MCSHEPVPSDQAAGGSSPVIEVGSGSQIGSQVPYGGTVTPVSSPDAVMRLFLDVRSVRGDPSPEWQQRFLARTEVPLLAAYTEKRLRRAAEEALAADGELMLARWLELASKAIEGQISTSGPMLLDRSETSGTGHFKGHSAPLNRPRGRGDL